MQNMTSDALNRLNSTLTLFQAKKFLKNVDKDLARIKERLDLDEDDEEESFNSSVTIPNHIDSAANTKSGTGFFDSIRASQGRTACCLFIVIICVIIVVILVFAHYEFGAIEKRHHNHFGNQPKLKPANQTV